MKENTIGILAYAGMVGASLAIVFGIATSSPHETITVDPNAHQITQKSEKALGAIYYANVHTVTTVWNLDKGTKTVTDGDLTASGFIVDDKSKTETTAIQSGELAELSQKSPEAEALINICHLKVN